MNPSNLLLFSLFFSLSAMAQDNSRIELWQDTVPGETEPKTAPVYEEGATDNISRITKVTNPILEVFKPSKKISNGAGVIICPGGGYQILAIDLEGHEIAKWFTNLGYTAFVLQYRVPQKPEEALKDAQRALRIVRYHAKDFNLRKDKIGVMGFSAGASLSARLSTNHKTDSYPATDEIDVVESSPDFTVLLYPAYLDQGADRSLTPELMIDKSTPPMFIFATADDPYANSALVMATALRDHEVPVELHLLAEGGHGYGLRPGNQAAETWPVLLKKWLADRLDIKP